MYCLFKQNLVLKESSSCNPSSTNRSGSNNLRLISTWAQNKLTISTEDSLRIHGYCPTLALTLLLGSSIWSGLLFVTRSPGQRDHKYVESPKTIVTQEAVVTGHLVTLLQFTTWGFE